MRESIYKTNIELVVEKALKTLGLNYRAQRPTRIGPVLDFEVNYEGRKIDLEVDGPFHDSPKARSSDGFRAYRLKRDGYETIRISYRELDGLSQEDVCELVKNKICCPSKGQ